MITLLSHAPLDLLDKITTRCQRNIGGEMPVEEGILALLDRGESHATMPSSKR